MEGNSDILSFTEEDGLDYLQKYKVSQVFTKCSGSPIYFRQRVCELLRLHQTPSSHNTEKGSHPDATSTKLIIKSALSGTVKEILVKKDQIVTIGSPILRLSVCQHPTMLGNTCGDCGITIEQDDEEEEENDEGKWHSGTEGAGSKPGKNTVSMLHSIPSLKVSMKEAERLGAMDRAHLLQSRKLVLLVDLDQTLLHTTNDNVPPTIKDVYHFQLHPHGPVYHARLRPYTRSFLHTISQFFELHICTFGVREYAHIITRHLDPEGTLFQSRILSRNECVDPMSKKANLKSLFPCGDELVCIMDDRCDVWHFAPNVVQVPPYHFFRHTGDINAPLGLQKRERDDQDGRGFDFSDIKFSGEQKRHQILLQTNAINGSEVPSKKTAFGLGSSSEKSQFGVPASYSDDEGYSWGSGNNSKPDSEVEEKEERELTEVVQSSASVILKAGSNEKQEKVKNDKPDECLQDVDGTNDASGDAVMASILNSGPDGRSLVKGDGSDGPSDEKSEGDAFDKKEKREDIANEKKKSVDMHNDNDETDRTCNTEAKTVEIVELEEDEDVTKICVQESNSYRSELTENTLDGKLLKKLVKGKIEGGQIVNKNKIGSSYEQFATATAHDESTLDVPDNDDYLLHLEDILKKIHERFYSLYKPSREPLDFQDNNNSEDKRKNNENASVADGDCVQASTGSDSEGFLPDVKVLVPEIRSSVLRGCNIVFSSIVPQNTVLRNSKAYNIATSLGANVTDNLKLPTKDCPRGQQQPRDCTTHLVAANLHTQKVHVAKRARAVKVVTPDWLWCCMERWDWVDERLFPLTTHTATTLQRNPPHHCLTPPQLFLQNNPEVFYVEDTAKLSMLEEVTELLDSDDSELDEPTSKGTKKIAQSKGTKRPRQDQADSSSSSNNSNLSSSSSGGYDDDDEDEDVGHDNPNAKLIVEDRRKKRRKKTSRQQQQKRLRKFECDPSRSDGVLEDDDNNSDEEDELPSVKFRRGEALWGVRSSGDLGSSSSNSEGMEELDSVEQERLLRMEEELMES